MLENPSSTHPDFDATWRRLELLVDEVAQWAKNAESLAEFYGFLLQRTVTEMAVAGGAVWCREDGDVQRIDMIGAPAIEALTQRPAHRRRILAALDSPEQPSPVADSDATSTFASHLTTVVIDNETAAVVELFFAAETTLSERENAEHVMAALADVSIDFHRAAQLKELRLQAAAWDASHEFSDHVHRRLDLNETCYAIANEGRRLIGADRLSVLVARHRSLRVRAISGVETVDRRAPEVELLRGLCKAVAEFGEPLWSQESQERPPQIQQLLEQYQDLTSVKCLAVIPIVSAELDSAPRLLGVLVAEQFKGDRFDSAEQTRLAICCRHATTAISNSLEMNSLPLLWVSRGMRSLGWLFGFQSLAFFALALVVAVILGTAAIVAMCLVTVDFTIMARGQLQPTQRQVVFAPADGVVQQTHVKHGDAVEEGSILVELRNSALDYEAGRLQGDLATTRAKLQAVQAARLAVGRDRQQMAQVTAEIARTKQLLLGIEEQFALLQRQREELVIRAPMAGQVMSWETERTLASRPVKQGQRLTTIADVGGPWQLEVEVSDADIGHVLHANNERDQGLAVSFILLTDPAVVHHGQVTEVALGTEVRGNQEPSVQVTVAVDHAALQQPRPGAGVVARIHCGRRSIGYVWFRSLYEKIRLRTML